MTTIVKYPWQLSPINRSPRLYNNKSQLSPRTRYSLTNKHIILDIDECLVHTFEGCDIGDLLDNPHLFPLKKKLFVLDGCLFGFTRDGLREFLGFCFKFFKSVRVFSAGGDNYVNSVCNVIFKDLPKPDSIWTRDKCRSYSNGTYSKPLSLFYEEFSDMKAENTVIVDDRGDSNGVENPFNMINIPAYEQEYYEHFLTPDSRLMELQQFFMSSAFMYSDDVRLVAKDKIFS